jgi:hypothetical protein
MIDCLSWNRFDISRQHGSEASRCGIDRNQLLLETKLNSRSFFARNREDFAKHAVTAAISGIVGGIVGWFVGHFLK